MSDPAIDFSKLSVQEKLELIEQLWESITPDQRKLPPTPAQKAELDARLDDFERDPSGGIPWDEVKKQIRRSENLTG